MECTLVGEGRWLAARTQSRTRVPRSRGGWATIESARRSERPDAVTIETALTASGRGRRGWAVRWQLQRRRGRLGGTRGLFLLPALPPPLPATERRSGRRRRSRPTPLPRSWGRRCCRQSILYPSPRALLSGPHPSTWGCHCSFARSRRRGGGPAEAPSTGSLPSSQSPAPRQLRDAAGFISV